MTSEGETVLSAVGKVPLSHSSDFPLGGDSDAFLSRSQGIELNQTSEGAKRLDMISVSVLFVCISGWLFVRCLLACLFVCDLCVFC